MSLLTKTTDGGWKESSVLLLFFLCVGAKRKTKKSRRNFRPLVRDGEKRSGTSVSRHSGLLLLWCGRGFGSSKGLTLRSTGRREYARGRFDPNKRHSFFSLWG